MKSAPKFATLLLALLSPSCASPREAAISDGGVTLTYRCGDFQPRAKTADETLAVMKRSAQSILDARADGDEALARSLKSARELRDVRRAEELTVEQICSAKK